MKDSLINILSTASKKIIILKLLNEMAAFPYYLMKGWRVHSNKVYESYIHKDQSSSDKTEWKTFLLDLKNADSELIWYKVYIESSMYLIYIKEENDEIVAVFSSRLNKKADLVKLFNITKESLGDKAIHCIEHPPTRTRL